MSVIRYIDYWHNGMANNSHEKPHPYLTDPILFITNLPTYVTIQQVERLLDGYNSPSITIQQAPSRPRTNLRTAKQPLSTTLARIEFSGVAEAERACALLHLQPYPTASPHTAVEFSFSADRRSNAPPPKVRPRLLKSVSPRSTSSEIYALLRRFGPIHSLGEHVHFWAEDDAKQAEKSIHLFAPDITLHLFDPRVLQCTNIPREIHTAQLQAIFENYGPTPSVKMFKPRQVDVPKYASVFFATDRDALIARNGLQGHKVKGSALQVSFRPQKPPSSRRSTPGSSRTSVVMSSRKTRSSDSSDDDATHGTNDSFATAFTGHPSAFNALPPTAPGQPPLPSTTIDESAPSTRSSTPELLPRKSPGNVKSPTSPKAPPISPSPMHSRMTSSSSLSIRPDILPVKSPTRSAAIGSIPKSLELRPSPKSRAQSTPDISSSPPRTNGRSSPSPFSKSSPLVNGLKFSEEVQHLKQIINEVETRSREQQDTAQAEISRLESQHETLRNQASDLLERCQILGEDVSKQEKERQKMKAQHETALREATATIEELKQQLESERRRRQTELAEATSESSGLRQTIVRQQDMLSDVRHSETTKLEQLRAKHDGLRTDYADIVAQNIVLTETLLRTANERKVAMESLATSEREARRLKGDAKELNSELDDALKDLRLAQRVQMALQQSATVSSTLLDQAMQQSKMLQAEVEVLKQRLSPHRSDAYTQTDMLEMKEEFVAGPVPQFSEEELAALRREVEEIRQEKHDVSHLPPLPPSPPPPPIFPQEDELRMLREEVELLRQQRQEDILSEPPNSGVSNEEADALRQEIEALRQRLDISESHRQQMEVAAEHRLTEYRTQIDELEAQEEYENQHRASLDDSIHKLRRILEDEEEQKRVLEDARLRALAERVRQEEEIRRQEEEVRLAAQRAELARLQEEQAQMEAWRSATEREIKRCWERHMQLRGGMWTEARVLPWFLGLLTDFETLKFSEARPLTVGAVPWPVRYDPMEFALDFVEWGEVEHFFQWLAIYTKRRGSGEYKGIVERVHRAFHPDRWSSRGLLQTVMDDDVRKAIERAGNMVSQAVTPIWVKSRRS